MLRRVAGIAFFYCLTLSTTTAFSQNGFRELSAREKQDHLWQKMSDSQYGVSPDLATRLDRLLGRRQSRYCLLSENIGSAAKIEFVPLVVPYIGFSGIYRSGALGMIRLSLTSDSEVELALQVLIDDSVSIGVKLTRPADVYGPKANWSAGTFFEESKQPLSIIGRFLYSESPVEIPGDFVDNIAKRTSDGRLVFQIYAPQEIFLVPSQELKEAVTIDTPSDFRIDLADNLPKGTIVYKVLVKPFGFNGTYHIANIVTRSEFIASGFSDNVLFK